MSISSNDIRVSTRWFECWWSISSAALMLSTLPVWRPDTVSLLPRVPLFGWGAWIPPAIEWTALLICALGLLLVLRSTFRGRRFSTGYLLWVFSSGLLIAADQLRFQPWWLYLVLTGCIISTASPRGIEPCLRGSLIVIYGWSAWSKCDYSFLTSHGRELTRALFHSVGLNGAFVNDVASDLAWLLPLGEILVAILLMFSRTRRAALIAAIVMHLLLGLALGPTGLAHSPGVLIWNIVCIAQIVGLLKVTTVTTIETTTSNRARMNMRDLFVENRPAVLLLSGCALFPLLSPWGWCDPWCAWELYASRPARAEFYIDGRLRSNLPAEVRRHVSHVQVKERWCRVRLDQWVLEDYSVPIASGRRVSLALANGLCEQFRWSTECRVDLFDAANRLNGDRNTRTIIGADRLREELKEFLLNVTARLPDETARRRHVR